VQVILSLTEAEISALAAIVHGAQDDIDALDDVRYVEALNSLGVKIKEARNG
jgi:hypothetical protein